MVALLYGQVTGAGATMRRQTHVVGTTSDFATSDDLLLADTDANTPPVGHLPALGDYDYLMAVGPTFDGVFSANNTPGGLPGAVYNRCVMGGSLCDPMHPGGVVVQPSIDPFFVKVANWTPPPGPMPMPASAEVFSCNEITPNLRSNYGLGVLSTRKEFCWEPGRHRRRLHRPFHRACGAFHRRDAVFCCNQVCPNLRPATEFGVLTTRKDFCWNQDATDTGLRIAPGAPVPLGRRDDPGLHV